MYFDKGRESDQEAILVEGPIEQPAPSVENALDIVLLGSIYSECAATRFAPSPTSATLFLLLW